MTMIRSDLENKLYAAISSAFNLDNLVPGQEKDDSTLVYEELARELSIAIDDYIKTATVSVTTSKSIVSSVSSKATINTKLTNAKVKSVSEIIKSTGELT